MSRDERSKMWTDLLTRLDHVAKTLEGFNDPEACTDAKTVQSKCCERWRSCAKP